MSIKTQLIFRCFFTNKIKQIEFMFHCYFAFFQRCWRWYRHVCLCLYTVLYLCQTHPNQCGLKTWIYIYGQMVQLICLDKFYYLFSVSYVMVLKACPYAQCWQVIPNSSPVKLWYRIWHHKLILETKTKWESLEAFQNLMDTNYAALQTPFVFLNWNYNGGFPLRAEAFS